VTELSNAFVQARLQQDMSPIPPALAKARLWVVHGNVADQQPPELYLQPSPHGEQLCATASEFKARLPENPDVQLVSMSGRALMSLLSPNRELILVQEDGSGNYLSVDTLDWFRSELA
jgi:hypothetical protein